ncbi:hypothetical protein QYF36_014803 [Acer negundo]|nr:hypothetical protein QYF36_014803 [Acer negundo]
MLNLCNDDTRRYLLEIFSALTLMREVRRVLSSLGGLRFLFEAARFGSMVSRERACQAIGLLRVRRLARSRHVELGVIPVLVELFRVGDSTIKVVAEAGAILLYAELLQRPDFIGKEIAEDVFCILAVAEENAVSIAEHTRDENVEVRERVTGVIAKLSYDEADRVALADTGAVPLMIDWAPETKLAGAVLSREIPAACGPAAQSSARQYWLHASMLQQQQYDAV